MEGSLQIRGALAALVLPPSGRIRLCAPAPDGDCASLRVWAHQKVGRGVKGQQGTTPEVEGESS